MNPIALPTSLGHRLSLWLAIQTSFGLAIISIVVYLVISDHLSSRQIDSMIEKQSLVHHLVAEARLTGDMAELNHKLEDFLAGHHELVLTVKDASNQILFESNDSKPDSEFANITTFPILSPDKSKKMAFAVIKQDGHADTDLLQRLAITLASVSLLGTLLVSFGAYWLVKKGLKPVDDLAAQTTAMSAESLPSLLDGSAQPKELQPLVTQFNHLLQRLSLSYNRLEHFNADVAHELNTPLTTLIMSTELALRTPQAPDDLHELLGSNLEELHRMSGIVKDMLFLSRAERGSRARCEAVDSLATVAAEVADYHEAVFADAQLTTRIYGDATGQFDVPLVKRALSNLLGNAASYAVPDSVVDIDISQSGDDQVSIAVVNTGDGIPESKLNRIFDRFYRLDESRTLAEKHHGLGLSIVAGIARMHGGTPYAQSSGEKTIVGFRLPKFNQSQLTAEACQQLKRKIE